MSVTPFPFHEPGPLGDSLRTLARNVDGYQPDGAPSWRAHVASLLNPIRDAFERHRAETEGDTGLYAELVQDAPRLAHEVDCLVQEHANLDDALARLADIASARDLDPDLLRRAAQSVVGGLDRHRQRDSDLVYEAYTTDIGGLG